MTAAPNQYEAPTEEWYCPNCGESGGSPRTVVSREYQGDSPHGGMVEWEDDCCSLCVKERP